MATIAFGTPEERQLEFTNQGYRSPNGKLYEKSVFGYSEMGAPERVVAPTPQYQGPALSTAVTTGMAVPQTSLAPNTPIPASDISPIQQLRIASIPQFIDIASASVEGSKSYASTLPSFQQETEASTQDKALRMRLSELIGQSGGQAQALATEEESRGTGSLRSSLADINSQISSKMAEYNKLSTDNQGRPITMNSIIGAERQILNAKAADIGLLQARAQGLQGQLSSAEESARKAVELRYAPILDEIRIKQAQIEMLKPQLDLDQRARAEALNSSYEQQKNYLSIRIQNEKDKNSTLLNLLQTYPDAGISFVDTIESANDKIVKNSRIYREKIRQPVIASQIAPVKLSAAQQEDIVTMNVLQKTAGDVQTLGERIGWSGTGGLYKGSLSQFLATNFGQGSPESQELRSKISNITATIAKLRGGTSFTTNEQKLLEQYTPTINDSPLVIKSKIKSLNDFINDKRSQVGSVSQGIISPKRSDNDPLGIK